MRLPFRFGHVVVTDLPSPLAKQLARGIQFLARQISALDPREPQLGVLLPVPVGGQLDERAKARFRFAQPPLRLLALGDVPADAAVTEKFARRTVERLAADRAPAQLAGRIEPRVLEIDDGLARFDRGAVCGPSCRVRIHIRAIPARRSELLGHRSHQAILRIVLEARLAMLGVRLPVVIRRELDQAAKAFFRGAQLVIRALLGVRHVMLDGA